MLSASSSDPTFRGARALLTSAALLLLPSLAAAQGPAVGFRWIDGRGESTAALEAGDSLTVAVDGLTPSRGYDLVLRDPAGAILGFSRGTSAPDGVLGPLVLWWESGVNGPDPAGTGRGGDGFQTFQEAEHYLATHALQVEVRDPDYLDPGNGTIVATQTVPVVAPRSSPLLWFSDAAGNYRTSFEAGDEAIHVTGEGLPAGATIELFVVSDRDQYAVGDELVDVTGFHGSSFKKSIHLAAGSTTFTVPVWPSAYQRTGRFDLVARVNAPVSGSQPRFQDGDLLFHGVETGVHVRPAPSPIGPAGASDLQTQLAGGRTFQSMSPGFRFLDVFLRHNTIRCALDPTDIPPGHAAGDYAAIYVVRARDEAKWHAYPRIAYDLTEDIEIRRFKPGTLETSIGIIWSDPDPSDPKDMKCDVVLDFMDDFRPDLTSGTPGTPPPPGGGLHSVYNGLYDVGVDIIDHLNRDGFVIIDDPGDPGAYPVGRTEYDYVDAFDTPWGQYQDQNVDVRAVVAYPGTSAGKDVPVYGTNEKFPIILILHGNHQVCTNFNCTCSTNLRVPNHKGYDYLLDLWASHGFIAVSIDGYDITGCPTDRFIERGALILEHLRYWIDWNDSTKSDPKFSGRYWNRVDTTRVGIAGHSRGGEGVAAAVQLNRDLSLGYNLKSALTIAPTDYNWSVPPGGGPTEFLVEDVPLLNIMGSSDGDVVSMDGAQIWDRAEPINHRATKAQAFVYGADHNSWNTVWIDPSWGGGSDGSGSGRISAKQQQDTGRVYFTAWWMATLQGRNEMLAFAREAVVSPKLSGVKTYWSYEAPDHIDIDHFEDTPVNKTLNSLAGANSATPAPLTWKESGLRPGNYDGSFYQDTNGVIVGWNTQTDYVIDIPTAYQDVSNYVFVALRAAQIWDNGVLNTGGSQHFLIDIEDVNGVRAVAEANSRAFSPIPVSYYSPAVGRARSMLSSIRVPLRAFTQNNSGVDLTKVAKVIVTFENTGLLAIDDIQFTK